MSGKYNSLRSFALSPDGSRLAVSAISGEILYDISAGSGRELHQIPSEKFVPRSRPVFSSDGKTLVVSIKDLVTILDASTGVEMKTLPKQSDTVTSLALSKDYNWLATAAGVGVKLWNLPAADAPHSLPDQPQPVTSLAFTPDSRRLATASDKSVTVWDVAIGHAIFTLPNQVEAVLSMAFSPDGAWLATAGTSMVRLWNAATGAEQNTVQGRGRRTFSFSPDGKLIASPGYGNAAFISDTQAGKGITLQGRDDIKLGGIALSPDRARVAATDSEERLHLWELWSGRKVLPEVTRTAKRVQALAFSADSSMLATGTLDGKAQVWDMHTGRELDALPTQTGFIVSVAFSPDGTMVATGGRNTPAPVRIWSLTSHSLLRDLPKGGNISGVDFSPNNASLATMGSEGFDVWKVATGEKVLTIKDSQEGEAVTFSQNGKFIATSTRVWDLASGGQLLPIQPIRSAGFGGLGTLRTAFSLDGTLFAGPGPDTTAQVWDLRTPKARPTKLFGNSESVVGVAFSVDGKHVYTVCSDFTVRLHPLDLDELVALAKKRVPRELTEDERRIYLHEADRSRP